MAAEIRGLVDLSMDIYDRPEFVHDLMRICTDWLTGFYRRLGETGIHSISMNETWTGVGVAREHFVEFMKPYDAECVQAAHDAGYMVSFHNCGGRRSSSRTSPTRDRTPWRPSPPAALRRRRSRRRQAENRRPRVPLRRVQRAPPPRRRRRRRPRRGAACLDAAMGGGGYVLDRADLRREAGPDRAHVRDGARSRSLQLSGGKAVARPTSTTSAPSPTDRPVRSR